jgi:hypothetical protein
VGAGPQAALAALAVLAAAAAAAARWAGPRKGRRSPRAAPARECIRKHSAAAPGAVCPPAACRRPALRRVLPGGLPADPGHPAPQPGAVPVRQGAGGRARLPRRPPTERQATGLPPSARCCTGPIGAARKGRAALQQALVPGARACSRHLHAAAPAPCRRGGGGRRPGCPLTWRAAAFALPTTATPARRATRACAWPAWWAGRSKVGGARRALGRPPQPAAWRAQWDSCCPPPSAWPVSSLIRRRLLSVDAGRKQPFRLPWQRSPSSAALGGAGSAADFAFSSYEVRLGSQPCAVCDCAGGRHAFLPHAVGAS